MIISETNPDNPGSPRDAKPEIIKKTAMMGILFVKESTLQT